MSSISSQFLQRLSAEATVSSAVSAVEEILTQFPLHYGHGTENPADEAFALVFSVLDLPFERAEQHWSDSISDEQKQQISDCLVQRIETRQPLPYITGTAWFAGLSFVVSSHVLIPRSPIAELIENDYRPWVPYKEKLEVLDLCTGSGAIAVATAVYLSDCKVDAADISLAALEIARKNAHKHNVADRVQVIESDLFAALGTKQYDLIVSNPPYVPESSMRELPDEYHHEPVLALQAENNGLAIIDEILRHSRVHLKEDGILIVEVGEVQATVEQSYPQLPFTWLEFERGGEGVFMLHAEDLD